MTRGRVGMESGDKGSPRGGQIVRDLFGCRRERCWLAHEGNSARSRPAAGYLGRGCARHRRARTCASRPRDVAPPVKARRERALEEPRPPPRGRGRWTTRSRELTRIQAEMTGPHADHRGGLRQPAGRFRPRRLGAHRRPSAPPRPGPRDDEPPPDAKTFRSSTSALRSSTRRSRTLRTSPARSSGCATCWPTSRPAVPTGRAGWRRSSGTGCPVGAFEFQPTLSNRTRPDCVVRLPGDERGLVIDAKFPLEGFTQFREAKGDEARSRAARGCATTS